MADERDIDERIDEDEENEEDEEWLDEPVALEDLPAGNFTAFVGGFSPLTAVPEAVALRKHRDDQILVLPGRYDADVKLDSEEHLGLRIQGDAAADVDAIVFTGSLEVTAPSPEQLAKLQAQRQQAAAEEAEKAGQGSDGEESDAPATTGAARRLTVGHMTFLSGALFAETAGGDVQGCTFGRPLTDTAKAADMPARTLRCFGLCTPAFTDCRVYGMDRSAVYCYPHARPTFTQCSIIGAKKPPPPLSETEKRRRRNLVEAPPPAAVPATIECAVGVQLDASEAVFVECTVTNVGIGFTFHDTCKGTLLDKCAVSEVETVGYLLETGASPAIKNSSAKFCGRECIVVGAKAHPVLRGNAFVGDARLKDGAVVSGMCDNLLGLNGQLLVEGSKFHIKGFTSVPKDPTLIKPKKPSEDDE